MSVEITNGKTEPKSADSCIGDGTYVIDTETGDIYLGDGETPFTRLHPMSLERAIDTAEEDVKKELLAKGVTSMVSVIKQQMKEMNERSLEFCQNTKSNLSEVMGRLESLELEVGQLKNQRSFRRSVTIFENSSYTVKKEDLPENFSINDFSIHLITALVGEEEKEMHGEKHAVTWSYSALDSSITITNRESRPLKVTLIGNRL